MIPGFAFIIVVALAARRAGIYPALQVAIAAGVLAGIAATVSYDLARIPFLAVGYRLFAPVSTYGILITNGTTSSPLTETIGWAYNFMNGIGFAVAYAMFGLGRKWWWAIPFALALETMTIVTPYADMYGLRGKVDVIAIAYGAHLFYGAILGVVVQRAASWRSAGESPVPAWWALAAVAAVLIVLNRPWTTFTYLAPASQLAPAPAAVVSNGIFQPDWLRVGPGGCVLLENRDARSFKLPAPLGAAILKARSRNRYCFSAAGTQRVQLNAVPYSGDGSWLTLPYREPSSWREASLLWARRAPPPDGSVLEPVEIPAPLKAEIWTAFGR